MTTSTPSANLALLNFHRASEGKAPIADWRPARHQPMLDAYRVAMTLRTLNIFLERDGAAPVTVWVEAEHRPMLDAFERGIAEQEAAEQEAAEEAVAEEAAAEVETPKAPSYKALASASVARSTIEKPVDFIHAYLTANPTLKRKQAIAALVEQGVNYSTARTQYQRWFSKGAK